MISATSQLTQAQATLAADKVGQPSQVTSDQATIAADEVALTEAKNNLADATLTAPVGGTVVSTRPHGRRDGLGWQHDRDRRHLLERLKRFHWQFRQRELRHRHLGSG